MVSVNEITEPKFDIVDDTSFYMRNDPAFYRQQYFPTFSKIADMHRDGKQYNAKEQLAPRIDKGISSSCKNYTLAKNPDELCSGEDTEA